MDVQGLFSLAYAVLQANDTASLSIIKGRLHVDGAAWVHPPSLSRQGLEARVAALTRRADLSNDPIHWGSWWYARLDLAGSGTQVTRAELIALARSREAQAQPRVGAAMGAVPSWWQKELARRVLSATQHYSLDRGYGGLDLTPLLEHWPRRLLEDPEWVFIESPWPGVKALPLDHLWVAPLLSQFDEKSAWGTSSTGSGAGRAMVKQESLLPLDFAMDRLRSTIVVVGMPGGGKTTLLRWLARQLLRDPSSRFLLPVYVPLRRFAIQLRTRPGLRLLDFFLEECGVTDPHQQEQWQGVFGYWYDSPISRGDLRTTMLLLLDGWDEVPDDLREAVLEAIRALQWFPVILTSRLLHLPQGLVTEHTYLLAGLDRHGRESLARQWFTQVKQPEDAERLLEHLSRHPDLAELASNPFILTLLCAVGFEETNGGRPRLPVSRGALYDKAVSGVCNHHSGRHPGHPFTAARRRHVERLAYWLLAEVEDAPRFVFDRDDVRAALEGTADAAELFDAVLKPSRLVVQTQLDRQSFQFLHATVQEYLAAAAMVRNLPEGWQQRLNDPAWREVLRFAASSQRGRLAERFWEELAGWAARSDRFGMVAATLASLVAEAGARDGGKALLRMDLRDVLWSHLTRLARNRWADMVLVRAMAEVDAEDLVRRLDAKLAKTPARQRGRWLDALSQVPPAYASATLVKYITVGDESAAHRALQLAESERALVRSRAADVRLPLEDRIQAVTALAHARDGTSVDLLDRLLDEDVPALRDEVFSALAEIGGARAAARLIARFDREPDPKRRAGLIFFLGNLDAPQGRDRLLVELARRPPEDSTNLDILGALASTPISHDGALIADFLSREHPLEVRRAAAEALSECTDPFIRSPLLGAALDDIDREVREAALGSMLFRTQPEDVPELIRRMRVRRNLSERTRLLQLLLHTAHRYRDVAADRQVREQVLAVVRRVLRLPRGELAETAARNAHLLGEAVTGDLLRLLRDDAAAPDVREAALVSLGSLRAEVSIPMLRQLARRAEGEEALAAARALAEVAPHELLRIPGPAASSALADFSARSGFLVFESEILDTRGQPLGATRGASTGRPASTTAMDIALVIAMKEEFRELYGQVGAQARAESDTENGRTAYLFERPGPPGKPSYRCVAVFAGDMGPEQAAMLTSFVLRHHSPATVVNVGIAAGRRGDVRIGDVVVPTEVHQYVHAGKLVRKSRSGQASFVPAGRHYECSRELVRGADNFEFAHAGLFKAWQAACHQRFLQLKPTKQRNRLVQQHLLREGALLNDKPVDLVSVPFVVQDEAYWEELQRSGRYRVALEMEAGGVMAAIREQLRSQRSLILKGISDFAARDKAGLDAMDGGALRRFALRNALDLLWHLCEAGVLPRAGR